MVLNIRLWYHVHLALCQHILELNLDLVSEKAYDAATSYISVTTGEGFPREFPLSTLKPLWSFCMSCHFRGTLYGRCWCSNGLQGWEAGVQMDWRSAAVESLGETNPGPMPRGSQLGCCVGTAMGKPWENHGKTMGKDLNSSWRRLFFWFLCSSKKQKLV